MKDSVEKTIEIRAPKSRVWRAISNGKDFGTWFGLGSTLELAGDFVPGAKISGRWVVDGKETVEPFCVVERVEPERLLSFHWIPYEIPPGADPDKHTKTRIEFRLEDTAAGTRLTVTESGFAQLPPDKQYARARNGDGWAAQLHSIAAHVVGPIVARASTRIARPLADVMEAIVDPKKMSQYFISRGDKRLATNETVEWEWSDVGAKLSVLVRHVGDDKVGLFWNASGSPTQVAIELSRDGDQTKITVTEMPFELSEEAAARAIEQTQGWTDFCCSLKAYLQHGINLRVGKPADHVA